MESVPRIGWLREYHQREKTSRNHKGSTYAKKDQNIPLDARTAPFFPIPRSHATTFVSLSSIAQGRRRRRIHARFRSQCVVASTR